MVNRQDDGKMQVNYMCGVCLPDKDPNKEGEEHQGSEWYINWHQIKEDLIDIKEGLKEEKENNSGIINSGGELIKKLSKVITCVPHMPRAKNAAEGIEAQLNWIKALLKDLIKAVLNFRALSTTWTNVTAAEV